MTDSKISKEISLTNSAKYNTLSHFDLAIKVRLHVGSDIGCARVS